MPLGSGMAGQFGIVAETSYGLPVTVSRFYPFVSESLAAERGRLDSEAIIAGARSRRSAQWAPGAINVGGDIQMELYQQHTALLFSHMLGGIASTTSGGIATHTATLGDLSGKSLTVQVGRPTVGGTVIPYTYSGMKIAEWEMSAQVDEIVTLGLTMIGQDETTGIALASATYGTDAARPFVFTHGSVSIAGSPVDVRGITLRGGNSLADDRWRLGAGTRAEPLENELRELDGTITMEFTSTAQWDRYRLGSEFSVALTLSAAPNASVSITANARYDGAVPAVDGRGLIVVESPIVLIGATSDNDAITVAVRNTQTAP